MKLKHKKSLIPITLKKSQRQGMTVRDGRLFMLGSLLVLAITSLIWSYYSARLHMHNADQLVSPYLFESGATFRGAVFPTSHTFLLKWPLFWVVAQLHFTTSAFVGVTMFSVLITLIALMLLVYYVSHKNRALVGLIALSLSALLLYIPIQPYAGALLPVNMGMLTTRNIEYIWFIGAIALFVASKSWASWQRWAGLGLLAVLIASDRLFVALALGAAGITMAAQIVRALKHRKRVLEIVRLSEGSWLLWSVIGVVAGIVLTQLLGSLQLTHFSSNAGRSSPYALVDNLPQLIKGVVFAALSLTTNFGANPLYDIATVHDLRQVGAARLASGNTVGYFTNGLLLILTVIMAVQICRAWLRNKQHIPRLSLIVYLIASAVVSVGIFAVSDHYFPVDARYIAVTTFIGPLIAAFYLRRQTFAPDSIRLFAIITVSVTGLGLAAFNQNYHRGVEAQRTMVDRNRTVAEVLKSHPVDTVLGDYWRVVPLKHEAKIAVTPLDGCTTERDALSSKSWRPDLTKHSFAYLLTSDKSLTDFPQCKFEDVTRTYGRPNSSVVVAGKVDDPKEAILFYDRGIRPNDSTGVLLSQSAETLLPQLVASQPTLSCPGGKPTIMNVVAHEDDDLLFQSPDLLKDIQVGNCVRTVYITAGDAGENRFYWLERETGSKAAYLEMLAQPNDTWNESVLTLGKNQHITIATPQSSQQVSLAFLRLPDGNVRGTGFGGSQFASLEKLRQGNIPSIKSVDGQSDYTYSDLQAALKALATLFDPSEIRTQADRNANEQYPDHSDHKAVGATVRKAFAGDNRLIKYYTGYPVHAYEPNVGGAELDAKTTAFLAYAQHDPGVCRDLMACRHHAVYGLYLERQYQLPPDL